MATIDDVLAFWFADTSRAYKKDPAFDAEIRRRFGELHTKVAGGEHEDWIRSVRGVLAYVIVLDQFSRNLYRDDPRAFASDPKAVAAAASAIENGIDQTLSQEERGWLYMPFMHSESLADQDRSVALFEGLSGHEYAKNHRDIIVRFGRFPHRNAVLGRESTDEERAFLAQPGSSF